MIVVKKKMKKPLIVVILAAILAVLITAAILIDTFLIADSGDGGNTSAEPPEIMEELGESIYLNTGVAYPRVEEDDIQFVVVRGENEYSFLKYALESGEDAEPSFVLSYIDGNGDTQQYLPSISVEDPTFEYNDMYAVEQNDGYGTITKLTYLCSAVGTLYFDERMKLSDDAAEKADELEAFGLADEDDPIEVYFTYLNEEGVEGAHYLKIGKKLVTGSGYYYMVGSVQDGAVVYRPYVYTTYGTYLDYAFLNFTDFINPILTAAGLPQDNAFEPYLTTDYQQWKNTLHEPDEDKGIYPEVEAGSTVIVNAITYVPNAEGGLDVEKAADIAFDLSDVTETSEYRRLIASLVGKKTGSYDTSFNITIPIYSNAVDLAAAVKYRYEITSIEAIVTESEDITAEGSAVGDNDIIKIGYSLYRDGAKVSEESFYGVIDLSSDLIPEDVRSALKAGTVGSFAEGESVSFERTYTEDNSVVKKVELVITDILKIVDKDDIGAELDNVQTGAEVAFSCYYIVDGEKIKNSEEFIIVIDDEMTDGEKLIADAIMDKAVGDGYEIKVDAYSMNAEVVASYTEYEVSEIKYFVTKEKIVSFRFEQASKRNPYYGESLYTNTMEGDYSMYALNAASCESVVKILGGLLTNASSSTGLIGTSTVDVVLTPEKMYDYNLYDYSIYFEIPRGISSVVYDAGVDIDDYLTSLDDYTYYSTLGFNLYISRQDPVTGNRYIASDLYDLVAEIDGDDFIFLEQNFIDFYARKNVVLVDISDIGSVELEFSMDDVYGTYSNVLQHNEVYAYGGSVYTRERLIELFGETALQTASKFDAIDVIVTPEGELTETEFSKYLAANGLTYESLRKLYGNEFANVDSVGTSNFKEFIETLFYTAYEGSLTAEEQEEGFEKGKLVMKMSVSLTEESQGFSAYNYVYEFYRISDRRVMVKLYRENRVTGAVIEEVSNFYISTFSFKRLVYNYFAILNIQTVDSEVPYPDNSFIG